MNVTRDSEKLAAVNTQSALDDACRQLQAIIKDRKVVLEVGELPVVMGNARQISQLIQNLIGNAIKYQPEGRQPKIRVSASREVDEWHFVIEDNGIGIPDKHIGAVFEIFRRLHTDDEYSGTGIGLSQCKRIVARHRGRIWAESARARAAASISRCVPRTQSSQCGTGCTPPSAPPARPEQLPPADRAWKGLFRPVFAGPLP